jgi:hypothetical protein
MFLNNSYSIQNKFDFLEKTMNNRFLTKEIKEEFLQLFYLIQKTYMGFSRLAYLFKFKKAKTIIEYDLCLNPIEENNKYVFTLLQDNNKYLFTVQDLIKLIHNAIANTNNFFNNPLVIKNPYNNVSINKSSLYNIYFFIKTNTKLNPQLFYYFFKVNFNINEFVNRYKFLIREFAINNYLNNSTNDKLVDDINQMIDYYNYEVINKNNEIYISNEFPKNILVKVMKPYLYLYFLSEYSLMHISGRVQYKKKLVSKLIQFKKYNPLFGRKTIKYSTIKTKKGVFTKKFIDFDYKHIPFINKNNDINTFMDSHNAKFFDENDDLDTSDDDDEEILSNSFSNENLTIIEGRERNFLYNYSNFYLINEPTVNENFNYLSAENENNDDNSIS